MGAEMEHHCRSSEERRYRINLRGVLSDSEEFDIGKHDECHVMTAPWIKVLLEAR